MSTTNTPDNILPFPASGGISPPTPQTLDGIQLPLPPVVPPAFTKSTPTPASSDYIFTEDLNNLELSPPTGGVPADFLQYILTNHNIDLFNNDLTSAQLCGAIYDALAAQYNIEHIANAFASLIMYAAKELNLPEEKAKEICAPDPLELWNFKPAALCEFIAQAASGGAVDYIVDTTCYGDGGSEHYSLDDNLRDLCAAYDQADLVDVDPPECSEPAE